jgi:hypothetical protein
VRVVVIWCVMKMVVEVDIKVTSGGDISPAIVCDMEVSWRMSVGV